MPVINAPPGISNTSFETFLDEKENIFFTNFLEKNIAKSNYSAVAQISINHHSININPNTLCEGILRCPSTVAPSQHIAKRKRRKTKELQLV